MRWMPILLSLIANLSWAQSAYQPLESNKGQKNDLLTGLAAQYNKDVSAIEGKYKSEVEARYTERYERLRQMVEDEHILLDDQWQAYFDGILQNIVQANPELQKQPLRLLISRYFWPNASCYGEGTIVLNLGLISRLENESQVAFVICHELAHQQLDHVNEAIRKQVAQLNSKQTKKELKRISKLEYGRFEKASALLEGMTFVQRRHSRQHESEADQMALQYMKNTAYDSRQSVACLAILDQVDIPKRPRAIDFKKLFDSEHFSFRDRWLTVEENAFSYVADEEEQQHKDSLKTHPDCSKRIAILEKLLPPETTADATDAFRPYAHGADYEMIEGTHRFGLYGLALFQSFLLVEEFPDDPYLHGHIVDCLFELYQHQKRHELSRVISLPDQRFEPHYNQYLHFIHNLRLRDLGKLGYYYGLKNAAKCQDYEDFRVAHLQSAALVLERAEWLEMKRAYFADFPKGEARRFVRELKYEL